MNRTTKLTLGLAGAMTMLVLPACTVTTSGHGYGHHGRGEPAYYPGGYGGVYKDKRHHDKGHDRGQHGHHQRHDQHHDRGHDYGRHDGKRDHDGRHGGGHYGGKDKGWHDDKGRYNDKGRGHNDGKGGWRGHDDRGKDRHDDKGGRGGHDGKSGNWGHGKDKGDRNGWKNDISDRNPAPPVQPAKPPASPPKAPPKNKIERLKQSVQPKPAPVVTQPPERPARIMTTSASPSKTTQKPLANPRPPRDETVARPIVKSKSFNREIR